MSRVIANIDFQTSVYAVAEVGALLFVGGSDWNRREVPYTKELAEESRGLLYRLRREKDGFVVDKKIYFPSMVYSLVDLGDDRIFVGCKNRNNALNVINTEGEILKAKNDESGGGVYNAMLDSHRSEIIVTTRHGKLEFVDANSLEIKESIQLSSKDTRLWSLKFDEKSDVIYVGDYDGVLYILRRDNSSLDLKKLDLKSIYSGDERLNDGFGPSLWGLENIDEQIIAGTRWGDVFFLTTDLSIDRGVEVGEGVTCLEFLNDKEILIGTRYGKLFVLDLTDYKLEEIKQIEPTLQKENAIWGMGAGNEGVWCCFADGNVCLVI